MRGRLVVFPIKGRSWCFGRSIENLSGDSNSSNVPSTFKDLYKAISSSQKPVAANAQLLIDFGANKMDRAWTTLETAPAGSIKSKIHGLGLRLLSRVKPSEMFLKSISNEITTVEILYPSSLNARFVRRRLRHIALRGTIIHKKFFYGSVSVLPLTSVFMVLPLPNIPFFWTLFRTYSHWRALKGSEKLLQLVSDNSEYQKSSVAIANETKTNKENSDNGTHDSLGRPWVLRPSKELDELLNRGDTVDGLSECTISDICKIFKLNTVDVLKYRHSL